MNYYDYIRKLKEYERIVEDKQIECNVYLMAMAFYEQHKVVNGSYKALRQQEEYSKLMSERYTWITGQIKETIDCTIERLEK